MQTAEKSTNSLADAVKRREFPGPRGHWFSGCIRPMRNDPLGLYTRLQTEYGDYVKMCVVPSIYCYILTHPDAVEHVLLKNHKNYRKPDIFYKSMGLLVGDGLFTNEGEAWKKQRRLAQPAFHSSYLALLAPHMVAGAESFVNQHKERTGQPIDMVDEMMRLGLRIASTTLFSADISADADRIGRAFRTAFAHVSYRLNSMQLIPNWMPTPRNLIYARAKRLLDRAVLDLIAARRHAAHKPNDLLSMLIASHDEQTGDGMPTNLLMDEVLTLLTAGHETMGAALSWTWYLLASHPQLQESLFDEIRGRLQGASPAVEDLEHLPLANAVFEESLRLYPPGWGELRETIEPDQIDGCTIPAKSLVLLCQWVTHRHPGFWQNPNQFSPERFLNQSSPSSGSRHRFAYFPFGGGPRVCIGTQFALMEGPLVIATILQRFRVRLASDRLVVPDATFALRPKGGLKVVLEKR
ncbi:MAG TPA: cytochrome P450 [Tepidisphaeraceae bacterium]